MSKISVSLEQFAMNIRWAVGALAPFLFLTSDKPMDYGLIAIIAVYNVVNLLHQIALIRKVDIRKYLPFILAFDLIIASLLIYNRGGFRSDTFHGYYVFILMSAILYGVRTTLFVSCLSAVVYAIIGFMQVSPELSVEMVIHRSLSRGFFFILLGIMTSYLSVRHEKQRLTIQQLEYERIQLQKETEESQKRANLDGLTEIYNHRYFQEKLVAEIQNTKESKWNLSLLMIDIDRFKLFNDTYGHLKGDYILKEIAKVLSNLLRKHDIVARYGGEEFSVILCGCDKGLAKGIAERIRRTIKDHDFDGLRVTVSIGVATMSDDDLDHEQLIDMADKALYEAKVERDNVCVA